MLKPGGRQSGSMGKLSSLCSVHHLGILHQAKYASVVRKECRTLSCSGIADALLTELFFLAKIYCTVATATIFLPRRGVAHRLHFCNRLHFVLLGEIFSVASKWYPFNKGSVKSCRVW